MNFIIGETSARKTTLINKLLNRRLYKGRNLETTSTVIKLRNSERIKSSLKVMQERLKKQILQINVTLLVKME